MAEPTGVIRPQPRNAALGALADFLQRANTAAARVQFNPQIAPQFTLADLLPLEGAAGLMQDVAAYGPRALIKGGNVATGGIGTFRPDPRILDVAEAAAIGAPVARAAARPVGRMAAQQIERAMSEGRGPLGAALGPVRPLPLDVYHGTPHRFPAEEGAPFGRFKAEKIGTGEGAQAYGYGHYTAEVPEVAKDYQYTLSRIEPEKVTYGGKSVDSMYNSALAEQDRAHRLKDRSAIDKANAKLAFWENVMVSRHPEDVIRTANSKEDGWPEFASYANSLDLGKFKGVADVGSLYKIDLPDEAIDKMLDWDKPLSEQPYAYNKLKKLKLPHGNSLAQQLKDDFGISLKNAYGQDIERLMTDVLGPASATSDTLRQAGIPGIKYLDQVSRGAGEGTRNFVVFPGNEDLLRIIERNNEKLPESSPGYAEGGPVIKEPSIFNLTDYAGFQAARMFPKDRGEDDRRDAARHMLAAGMLTRKFTPETAERLGRWYEYKESPIKAIGTLFGGSMPPDYDMDTHNNQVGIMLGQQAKDQADLERLVRKYAREAALNEKNEGQAMIRVLKHPPLPPQQRQLYAEGGIVRSEFEYDPAAVDARAAALMEEIDAA